MTQEKMAVDQADNNVTAPAVDMFAEFAVNEKAVTDGVWVPFRGDVEFLIARDGNTKHRRVLLKYWRENPSEDMEGTTDADQDRRDAAITAAARFGAARAILLGWKGNVQYAGKPMPYTVENAEKLLAMPDFMDWVSKQSAARANFAAKLEEAAAKN